jgi:hypothetical protein
MTQDAADHDNNGVTNLLAYGTGSVGTVPLNVQVSGPGGNRVATVTTQRNSAMTDATYVIESSTNLSQWTALATSVNGAPPTGVATISEGSGVVRQLSVQHAVTGAERIFYRVRLTMP